MKKVVIFFTMLYFGYSSLLFGSDSKHITFINQTDMELTFDVDVTGKDKHKTLSKHYADYVSFANNIGACGDKTYEITIKNKDRPKGKKGGNYFHKVVHRKCGENLYVWKKANDKAINILKTGKHPNIFADIGTYDKDLNKPAILFVHGYNDSQKGFGTFAKHAKKKGWRVFRTSVSATGSMAKRAYMLADYINKLEEHGYLSKTKTATLRAVGHSMGGLDLRYLVSKSNKSDKLLSAAKHIERIYTLATPHRGHLFGGTVPINNAASDMGRTQMSKFNAKNKYKDFKVKGRPIPLLAMRFRCKNKKEYEYENDGIVTTFRQVYPLAPYSKEIYLGKHSALSNFGFINKEDRKQCKKDGNYFASEQKQTKILDKILKDQKGENIPTYKCYDNMGLIDKYTSAHR